MTAPFLLQVADGDSFASRVRCTILHADASDVVRDLEACFTSAPANPATIEGPPAGNVEPRPGDQRVKALVALVAILVALSHGETTELGEEPVEEWFLSSRLPPPDPSFTSGVISPTIALRRAVEAVHHAWAMPLCDGGRRLRLVHWEWELGSLGGGPGQNPFRGRDERREASVTACALTAEILSRWGRRCTMAPVVVPLVQPSEETCRFVFGLVGMWRPTPMGTCTPVLLLDGRQVG